MTRTVTPPRASYLIALASHALVYDATGRLLVIRRGVSGYLDGHWSVPAGHVEAGESALEACTRETREEVGLDIPADRFEFVLVQDKSDSDGEARVDFFYRTQLPAGQEPRAASPREVTSWAWVTAAEELPTPFAPYVAHALEAVAAGAHATSWDLGRPPQLADIP